MPNLYRQRNTFSTLPKKPLFMLDAVKTLHDEPLEYHNSGYYGLQSKLYIFYSPLGTFCLFHCPVSIYLHIGYQNEAPGVENINILEFQLYCVYSETCFILKISLVSSHAHAY